MRQPGPTSNEAERLEALKSYNILDTLPEKDFDDITRIASEICNTPISLITLLDENRQWFKSRQGLDSQETPREDAFCAHAILQPQEIMIVADPRTDERFRENPLVTGEPHIQFYAGVPLVTPEGHALGTLCVIDQKTRELTPQQVASLQALANQVVAQLELRRKVDELNKSQANLKEANEAMENFAYNAAHDLKNPLNNIIALTGLLKEQLPDDTTERIFHVISHLNSSAYRLKDMVESLLKFSKLNEISSQEQEEINTAHLMKEVVLLMDLPPNFSVYYDDLPPSIITSKTALKHILVNLGTNAVKYNNKDEGYVRMSGTETDTHYIFQVQDNGSGIEEKQFTTIFQMFSTLGLKDRFNQQGSGLGLFMVKRLVEKMGGTIEVQSVIEEGTTFKFTIEKAAASPIE
uniref:histidine kinase n=1 Tax=Roseihalotalea indica TaxID=2867963 RepID=A0AA49GGD2_9BACT|nr:GAF domain-containing sensor histidine kinase [Tunicatimonas sp. TK19036]